MRSHAAALAVLVTTALAVPTTPAAAATATVVPIQVTGDPAKRFNLVVLGDGYTAAELPEFRAHLDKHLNVLWTIEPFRSYRAYVNVYAVETPSRESGVDCDPDLTSGAVDTPLDMGFWGGCNPASVQRLLTVNGTKANTYADLVPGTTRANRQLLALGNSDTYGGAGGANATASGGNALSALITPHELGHSLGGLQDEYDYYARGVRGDPYDGPEPASPHHTLLTEREMTTQHQKWWRWLGEKSESGGPIARYEGGLYAGTGVWRPSAHSMMKTLGYYFDQVSREQLTHRIATKVPILQDSVPPGTVGADRVLWVETMNPVYHRLTVTWTVDGVQVPADRSLALSTLPLAPGPHTVTATVTDPTAFVRDPALRASPALTQSRTWTVDTATTTPEAPVEPKFTHTTPTEHPVGAKTVVYAETTHPTHETPTVTWHLNGQEIASGVGAVELAALSLTGTHTLTATVGGETKTWRIDATPPAVTPTLSAPLLATANSYVYNAPFTMHLAGEDNTPGHVVEEFQTNADGWFNYFGWPTDPKAPFRFTPQGTVIDNLVYGKLGTPRLSPWDEVPTNYGTHKIEYRAIDPAGNTAEPKSLKVTLLKPPPQCTRTITGPHNTPLNLTKGVTCLKNATITGPISVTRGATLIAQDSTITGPLTTTQAAALVLISTTVGGPLTTANTKAELHILGSTIRGAATLTGNQAPVLSGTTVHGPLTCTGNNTPPTDLEIPNTVHGPTTAQCTR